MTSPARARARPQEEKKRLITQDLFPVAILPCYVAMLSVALEGQR